MSEGVSYQRLFAILERSFAGLSDGRTGQNTTYSMRDAALAAFSVFYMQSASFLGHQQALQDKQQRNNARSLFGIEQIPSDPQIRNLLDPVVPSELSGPFWEIFALLEAAGAVPTYRRLAGQWLIALDGTQYFASSKIHCQRCTVTVRNETEYYAHIAITPVLVAPRPRAPGHMSSPWNRSSSSRKMGPRNKTVNVMPASVG